MCPTAGDWARVDGIGTGRPHPARVYRRAMPRTDRAHRVIAASPGRVYAAFVDRAALEAWLPPDGMTARFERFDLRPGGSYRLVLTYTTPPDGGGKASADSDVVEARYVDIVPGRRVVQAVDFESDDPAFAGTMTMTWSVTDAEGGTLVEFVADDVPDGISAEDHAAGMGSSLAHLARYVRDGIVVDELADDLTVDITTTGRRSGLPRRIEIWMLAVAGRFFITGTTGQRDWMANLLADPRLVVHLKRHTHLDLRATATPVDDPQLRRAVLEHPTADWYRDQQPLDVLVEQAPLVEVVFDG
jgi:deazaflavin-dependent oxidoreductase (nitroreductase family)